MPLFSVIITAYNRAHLVPATITSVLAQTFSDYEVILVDDGSTDDLLKAIDPFRNRVRFFRQVNSGPGPARNLGIRHATGTYCAFLDGDDLWYPWTLSVMAEIIESRCSPALILGKSRPFSRDAEVIADVQAPTSVRSYADYFASARDSFWIGGSALVVKTVELRHAGCFTQERIIADDLDVCLRVGDRKGFVAVDCPLTFAYRQHSQNVSNSLDRLLTSIHYLITEEHSSAYAGGQTRQNARRSIICRHARPWAIAAAKSGRMRSAWDLFRRILPWCIREGRARFICGFLTYFCLAAFTRIRPPQDSTTPSGFKEMSLFTALYQYVPQTLKTAYRTAKQAVWLMRRPRLINDYLRDHTTRKLQIGAGFNGLDGWLNTDILPRKQSYPYMDATKRFPLPSEAFDYVFSEHIIEHISYDSGRAMLQECFRVLKPGGKVRISTPDLTVLLGLHRSPRSEMQERYIEWAISNFIPNATATRECFVINNAFRNWGHTFIYDKPSLEHLVRSVGFSGITWHEPHASDDPQLRGIETHGALIGDEEINRFEVMILQATKP